MAENKHILVHFNTKHIKGLTHSAILDQLETLVDRKTIKTIQINERDCVITVTDPSVKIKLLVQGIEIKNQHFKIMDVEKEVTNITIKDAPVELSDLTLCTYMGQYGEVVQGSIKRGTIKGTDIETGTRYIQIINCVPSIPNTTKLGRFNVRLFADNNRTQCKHCNKTDHPSYRCDQRPQHQIRKSCYRCNGQDHMVRECPFSNKVCFNCGQEGHIQRNCTLNKDEENERHMYGDYIHEIREGRNANLDASHDNEQQTSTSHNNEQQTSDGMTDYIMRNTGEHKTLQNTEQNSKMTQKREQSPTTVIIGASNCCRLKITDPTICNISVSGTTAENIDAILPTAVSKVDAERIDKVILCLGTNDVTKNKTDQDMINIFITNAINKLKVTFPNCRYWLF